MEKRGVIVVIYYEDHSKTRKYALFNRCEGWRGYEFLKGGKEEGERSLETANRELEEESGLRNKIVVTSKERYSFKKGEHSYSFDIFFTKMSDEERIVIDMKEHDGYGFFTKEETLRLLPFEEMKGLFLKIDREIEEHEQHH
jgi:8-oxo-dGTP pyrophosphatase MutT (NUDIX family)